jgi:hypothetical protein
MTRLVVVAVCLAAVTAVLVLPAAPADAASRRVCTKTATLRDTPRGFAIARLYRGQRVVVVRRSATRGWLNVRPTGGLPGWILARSLCRG